MLLSRHRPAEALPLLERAARWIDNDIDTLVALGHPTKAAAAFAQAQALETDYPNLPKLTGKLEPSGDPWLLSTPSVTG